MEITPCSLQSDRICGPHLDIFTYILGVDRLFEPVILNGMPNISLLRQRPVYSLDVAEVPIIDVNLDVFGVFSVNGTILGFNHTINKQKPYVILDVGEVPIIDVEFDVRGSYKLNKTIRGFNHTVNKQSPYDILDVQITPCPPNHYRVALACIPCTTCTKAEQEMSPCTIYGDRTCAKLLTVDALVLGVDALKNKTIPGFPLAKVKERPTYLMDVSITPCPDGQFRDMTTATCKPCRACRLLILPCALTSDAVCSLALNVGMHISNLDYWDAYSLSNLLNISSLLIRDDTRIQVDPIICEPDQYRHAMLGCQNCTVCHPVFETYLTPCTETLDATCSGQLTIDLSVFTNETNISLTSPALRHSIFASLSLDPGTSQLFTEITGITVTPILCPPLSYLDFQAFTCVLCDPCPSTHFMSRICSPTQTSTCQPCTICPSYAHILSDCTPTQDRTCSATVDFEFRIGNSSFSTQLLYALFDAILANASSSSLLGLGQSGGLGSLSPAYVQAWSASHGGHSELIHAATRASTLTVEILTCPPDTYRDDTQQACVPCSICDDGVSYKPSPCTLTFDPACTPCSACRSDQYPFTPCTNTSNTICYDYARRDLDLAMSFSSPVSLTDMPLYYIPAFLSAMQDQLWATSVTLLSVTQISSDTAYILTLTARFNSTFAHNPNPSQDYSSVIERALLYTDLLPYSPSLNHTSRRLLQASLPHLQASRRLLQASPELTCPVDTYLISLADSSLCIPCQDQLALPDPSLPPALRLQISLSTCPLNYARICFGGSTQPVCVMRLGDMSLVSTTTLSSTPGCPPTQQVAWNTLVNQPICQGIPCPPGSTGPSGYCTPCLMGTYKPTTGDSPCSPCPSGLFSTVLGAVSVSTCQACPLHASALSSDPSVCVCGSGYEFILGQCIPCGPGRFRLFPSALSCAPCPPGGFADFPVSSTCTPCPMGTFSSFSGATRCDTCPFGTYQEWFGSTHCTYCPPGHGENPDHTGCVSCTPGTYAESQGGCLECPPGLFTTTNGSFECISCQPGASSDTTRTYCEWCQAGTYANGPCELCRGGTFSTGIGSTTCTACDVGLYSPSPGSSSPSACVNCPRSTYWVDTPACVDCPFGTESPPAAESIEECRAMVGYYGRAGESAALCPTNYYCPKGAMLARKCSEGRTSTPGSSECLGFGNEKPPASYLLDHVVFPVWVAMCGVCIFLVYRGRRVIMTARALRVFRRE